MTNLICIFADRISGILVGQNALVALTITDRILAPGAANRLLHDPGRWDYNL